MYADMAKTAKEEGFTKIAFQMEQVGIIEKRHEERYKHLQANVENGEVFKKADKQVWKCAVCGYTVEAAEPPKVCPVCGFPQAQFAEEEDNWK